tara:strand:- start:92295 stop:92783 length:489 start_codon:yes stop_codon:yes gene_type:complete
MKFIEFFLIVFILYQPLVIEVGKSYPSGGETKNSGPAFHTSDGSDLLSLAYSNEEYKISIKFEEGNLSDALVTKKLRIKTIELAIAVEKEWEGEKISLRITEAWDTNIEHSNGSLHYEGRAIDITTSDLDKSKLPRLGGLAYMIGFNWVYNEGDHIHASIKE